ncbi:transglycosylase domain-containing protein [Desulfopila sp. IMCC35008]|uniref:transglycosylase domain-containing protein n=1 Tax=Desulfopila sp. IMCC35008 TaxID=2653858 RepID=UPI0013D89471|nr:transglycosylase domain-containing protein [Desulfopila sp. IMCC35008]
MLKKIFLFLFFLCFSAAVAGGGFLYWQIVLEPGDEIDANNIDAILGKESPVFYNDNQTQLGVFFDKAHRQYVTFSEIPTDFVNALVAAEDNRFFSHFGFDVFGIARAAIKNIEAGRVVQGGSTLTQQTAKNLFKRTERSFKAKFKELLYALRLEYHYPKEKIFEFYANQFYVSGNGHGLGVAARYYFDKEPKDLNLVECAFIAGSVKRPNYYNPFIKKTKEASDLARERARTRLKYVLDKMLELEMLGFGGYREALSKNINFNQGQVGYSLDYVMEMVKDAVSGEEVTQALAQHGVNNVSTSGIRIITTVDKDIQEKTLHALRHDLSRIDVLLSGYEREEVQQRYAETTFKGDRELTVGAFLFGKVESLGEKGEDYFCTIDFGRKIGTGLLDRRSFERLAEARVKWQKNLWAESRSGDVRSLYEQLQIGDLVWVSVRGKDENGTVLLELEKYPLVQGGALVLQNGAIVAMSGGVENRFYNRAVYGHRTMGSSFKPFLFTAALQLGWNSSDLLRNKRDVFVFHNQPYFPRPDHKSPFEQVSMSWAGVHSENVASIWLLAHLCDKLTPTQFREVADYLGLTPRVIDGEQEPYRSYRTRIRDRFGIVINKSTLKKGAFRNAVKNSEADFMFENMVDQFTFFSNLHYGLNFDQYSEQVRETGNSDELTNTEWNELQFRRDVLDVNYLKLEQIRESLQVFRSMVEDPLGVFQQDLMESKDFSLLYYNRLIDKYVFLPASKAKPDMEWISRSRLREQIFEMMPWERDEFWREIRLYDLVSVGSFDLLAALVEEEYKRLQRLPPYSFEVLSAIDDFRIYTGLRYLISLASKMGIRSKMEPVLSFPLGANVTTLLETTRMYETLVTGKLTTYGLSPNQEENDNLLIIDRIESEDGKLLYKPERRHVKVLDDKTRIALGHILENVIKFGTGRKADKQVRLQDREDKGSEINSLDLSVPLLGKTGTANRYTNASFYGYLPGLHDGAEGLTVEDGYAVGVYAGYDDNDPMRKGTIRITGSSGALPAWIDIVNELVAHNEYGSRMDPVDLSFSGLQLQWEQLGQQNLAVDKDNGGIVPEPVTPVSAANRYSPSILTFGEVDTAGRYEPARYFEPFWKVAGSGSR